MFPSRSATEWRARRASPSADRLPHRSGLRTRRSRLRFPVPASARHELGLRPRRLQGHTSAHSNAIEDELMRLAHQVQGRPESLEERHRPGQSLADAEEQPRTTPLVLECGTQKTAQDLGREPRVSSAPIAERIGQREDPHCRVGTSGSIRSTRWAAVSAMRRPPRDGQKPRPLLAKATSRSWPQNAQWTRRKVAGQHAALERSADLPLNEAGDVRPFRSGPGEEREDLRADDRVEKGLLGLVAGVVGGGRTSAGTVGAR